MATIQNVCFIDIESVPQFPDFNKTDHKGIFELYQKRFEKQITDPNFIGSDFEIQQFDYCTSKHYSDNAALYAEFGKVVSISIGKMTATKFQIKTIASRDEVSLLDQLMTVLSSEKIVGCNLVAHNGLEFDFPFLMRRYMINDRPLPYLLNVSGVKPWETKLEDTMKMWSGSAWNYKISLDLLCSVLGFSSPKSEMSGASVSDIYYGSFEVASDALPFDKDEEALKAIGKYNASDVLALANCYSRMKGLPLITPEQVIYV